MKINKIMWSKTNSAIRCSYSAATAFGIGESSATPHFVPNPGDFRKKKFDRQRGSEKTGRVPPACKIVPIVDLNNQSVEICNVERIRRSAVIRGDPLWRYMHSDAQTVADAFRRGMRVSGNGPCLGYRETSATDGSSSAYKWLTYRQVLERSENLARGLLQHGARPGQSTLIGVYSQNRPEVVIAEQACYFFSMVIVSLYDTLGPEACRRILDKTELEIVICDKAARAFNLLDQKRASPTSKLRLIVLMEQPSDPLKLEAYENLVQIVTFSQLEFLGAEARQKMPPIYPQLPKPCDLATICYTSGTSGNPKGAMISHENITAATTASHMLRNCRIRPGDVMLSFLPMAHMYERLAQAIFYSAGGCVGFSRGDVKFLSDDIRALRPHMLPTVPRLLNRIYDKIMQDVGGNLLKKWLLNLAVQAKISDLKKSAFQLFSLTMRNDTIWDSIVFRKLQDQMGGRVKLLLSGSAPMSREVMHLVRAGMGAMVLEGYGATETAAATCLTMEGDVNLDHVGIPVPCNEIKLVDAVEMNILAIQGKGEVCVRGHNVFRGYYKDAENTAKCFDRDGWFKTGDIGAWNANGTLSLLDRKKYLIKLDQGEYVTPEKIENVYNRTQFVSQSFVHGDNKKSYVVGVVVPQADALLKAVELHLGIQGVTVEKLCKNEKVVKMVHDDMMMEGHRAGLQTFEQMKRIILRCDQFTVENGLLTPTLKYRRNALKEKYKAELEKLYDS